MTHASLFSGIGGFDLAAHWMNWQNIFYCEKDDFCLSVLKRHFPNSIPHYDITKTDFSIYKGRINVLSGGFPCQPFSIAGNQKGTGDDRYLWPEMLRAIKEIQPDWIVGENVPGIINWSKGMVFHEVQSNLEDAGFTVLPPIILPACGVNAPHKRNRVWFIAHSNCIGCKGGIEGEQTTQRQRQHSTSSIVSKLQSSQFRDSLPTPRIFRGNDGIPRGVDRVHALGNAVVPQLVYQIFKTIEEFMMLDNI